MSGGVVMQEEDVLLTFKEAMGYLRVSRSTLYRLMWSGVLEGHKVGSTWRFKRADLRACVGKEVQSSLELPTDGRPITYSIQWKRCGDPKCACQEKYAQVHGYRYAYWKQNGSIAGRYVDKVGSEGEMSHFDDPS